MAGPASPRNVAITRSGSFTVVSLWWLGSRWQRCMLFLQRLSALPPRGQVGVVLAADGLNPIELPAFLGQSGSVSGRRCRRGNVKAARRHGVFAEELCLRGRSHAGRVPFHCAKWRDPTSIHRPELCLVGQGWTIERGAGTSVRSSNTDGRRKRVFARLSSTVHREIPSAGGKVIVPQLIAYSSVGGNRVVPSNWQRFVQDAWNRVTPCQFRSLGLRPDAN